jgi:hypothetical protein
VRSSPAGKTSEGLKIPHHDRTKMLRSILRGVGAGRLFLGDLGNGK